MYWLRLLLAMSACVVFSAGLGLAKHPVQFDVQLLTVDANEGCDVADCDGDGKLDVVAGRNWYRNGDWLPRPVRLIEDWNGYVRSNGESVYDVNGDGRPDVVSMDFTQGQIYWYENPGPEAVLQGFLWPQHLLVDTTHTTNEAAYLVDLIPGGKPEWVVNQWNKNNPMVIWSFSEEEREVELTQGRKTTKVRKTVPCLKGHTIGDVNGHGIGFGDLNNDGRDDIVFGLGWYECPADEPLSKAWTYHADWELHSSCPMLVYDVDGDGKNDLVWGKGHDYGMYWWRSKGFDEKGTFQYDEKLIDDSFSQPHCLHLADLDGDGQNELITGKRVRAHNGRDPGGDEPPIMRYYVWNQQSGSFSAYTIDEGRVGAGLQIRSADLDGDGDVDLAVAGKDGTQILWNRRK